MKRKGFTLIELLIVVAIIAILAAIAVPNFLEAQTRSKVARSKADMKSIATAIEAYRVDNNTYPFFPADDGDDTYGMTNQEALDAGLCFFGFTPAILTSPIAYMTSIPSDPFQYSKNTYKDSNGVEYPELPNPLRLYNYESHDQFNVRNPPNPTNVWDTRAPQYAWIMLGVGPDLYTRVNQTGYLHGNMPENFSKTSGENCLYWYDPTNGTVSNGDIFCYAGGGVDMPALNP